MNNYEELPQHIMHSISKYVAMLELNQSTLQEFVINIANIAYEEQLPINLSGDAVKLDSGGEVYLEFKFHPKPKTDRTSNIKHLTSVIDFSEDQSLPKEA